MITDSTEELNATSQLLTVSNLSVRRSIDDAQVLKNVSIGISATQKVGIVGESGSGKTTLVNAIIQQLAKGLSSSSGEIVFNDRKILPGDGAIINELMGNEIGVISQNPFLSLNPLFSVGAQFRDVLKRHLGLSKAAAKRETIRILSELAINEPNLVIKKYPHQLSGGMAQRVMIGIATACNPRLLIADEPTTGLDATIENQVVSILNRVVNERQSGFLIISHNLQIIAQLTDYTYVMYAGSIVEQGPTDKIISDPVHPYSKGLVSCMNSDKGSINFIPGRLPELGTESIGCAFRDRCKYAEEICFTTTPTLKKLSEDRYSACFLS